MFKDKSKRFFTHCKNYSLKQIISAAYIPAALIYFEVVFRIVSVKETPGWAWWLGMICASIAGGLLLDMLCTVTKNEKLNGWFVAIILQLTSLVFMIIHFVGLEFNIYIGPKSIFGGAGGITKEASDYILKIVEGNWITMALFEVPIIVFLVLFLAFKLFTFKRFKAMGYLQILLVSILFDCIAGVPLCNIQPYWSIMTTEYDFNTAIKNIDFQTSLSLDLVYTVFNNPFKKHYTIQSDIPVIEDPENYNIMELDFDKIASQTTNTTITEINNYVQSLTPTKKNEYTGLFKGKNLIQITAESFTPYIVDKDLTPTLYRLLNNGFIFENYYQPLWSGSTTTGEFLILTGLLPSNGYYSMLKTKDSNMYLTIGNHFLREGYTSIAYHNGTFNYFNRNLTHCNLGYSQFVANGNGMYGLSGDRAWPQSDIEMMQFAIPRFVEKSPFNIYFMSLSGHSKYDSTNFIVNKNIDEVKAWANKKGLVYTNSVLSYLAANLEFEKAMEYLLSELEKAGVLENTVILITGDHYPYSLSDDYVIDENGHVDYFNVKTNVTNLFGFSPETEVDYGHNALIIWTPSMEGENSIVVTDPVCSVDILPTLSNLFGFEYDSRLLVGRDALDPESKPLVIFSDYSWLTDKGFYDYVNRTFTPIEELATTKEAVGETSYQDHSNLKTITYENPIDKEAAASGKITYDGNNSLDEYIKQIRTSVNNKMIFSQQVPLEDYYGYIWGRKEPEQTTDFHDRLED